MITDNQKELLIQQYYDRGVLKKEIRSYEVSLWTLQDEFITVLKWSDVEQKGRIESPKMTLNIDGTEKFTFSVPMYYRENGKLIENPNWYNVQNDKNLMVGMRKLKVIFNKNTEVERVFEFIITNVTETHERDILTCEIESEGLAFQELGKIGYRVSLSLANFELVYKEWETDGEWTCYDGTKVTTQPIQNVQYWCEEAGLEPVPSDPALINSRVWYYDIQMNWDAFADGKQRDSHVVYEEAYTSSWDSDLRPLAFENFREKARSIEVENSNLYNITKTIAEKFEIFCKYEYMYDENYHIIGRKVIFYNNFMQDGLGSITLQYPYSSSKISRTMDSTAITTKLFVLDVDEHGIADAEPNASREDYILNFDFLYQTGAITQEQYDAIQPYYKDVRAKNDELINLQNQLIIYQEQQPEIAAKKTVLENSIDIDKEQIEANQRLGNALGALDGVADQYIELSAANPDYLLIHTGENGSRYVNLSTTNKGIVDDSITVWATFGYDKDNKPQLSNQITGFTLDHDGSNNLTTLTFTQDTSAYTSIYLLYKYDPKLYYDNVIKIWETKSAQDELDLLEQTNLLSEINNKIESTTLQIERVLHEKEQIVKAFERLMGPALREGYWQPEDYSDYGDRKISNISLSTSVDLTRSTGKDMKAGWDSEPFTGEQKLYYEEGANRDKVYYPCVNLKSLFGANIPTDLSDYSIVWKATNWEGQSYDWNSIKDLRVLSIGSSALIHFIKFGSEGVIPVLVVTGAQAFTEEELERLTQTGEARLEKYSISVDKISGVASVSHGDTQISINNNWIIIDKNTSETTYPIVQPRIKNSAMTLKTDTDSLFIKYGNNTLSQFSDYYINTRIGKGSGGPEYYITIKPEILIKYGLGQNFNINYILSNANTAIYLDARKVSQENAYPKVSYSIDVNLLNTSLLHTLYSKLARIVMVNDTDLKFENTFGYISQVDLDLDNCQNDTVEIKNYKTKFEDLFSTIVAQTEDIKRSGAGLTTALSGGIPLSEDGFVQTMAQHKDILDAYLDAHFDSSQVVRDRLTDLFGEAGDILGGANKTLNKLKSLTIDNAGILSRFAENVAIELTTKIYRSIEKPASFKPGDIWIYTDEYGNEYRYLAMADSSSSGSGSDFGFVRTHDGSLASIRGANVVWDAEAGTVDITGENEINIRSGKNLYLAANADVNIVGNKSVNIGGSTINIGAGIGPAHFTVSGTIDTTKFKNKTNNEIGSFWFRYKDGHWTYKNNSVDLADYGITISVKANQSLVDDVDQLFVWNRGNDNITWMESNNNTMGSINLVASGITQFEEGKANTELAKVLISPYRIEMGAAELEMKAKSKIILRSSTGTYAKTAAISISAEEGVYIGAGQGVRIYSGSPTMQVYVGPAHYSKYQKGDIWVKIKKIGSWAGHIGYDGDAGGTNFYTTSILSGQEHNTFEVEGIYDALDNWNVDPDTPEPATDYGYTTDGWQKRSTANAEQSARSVIVGTGASIELNKEHLLLGFANIENNKGSAMELTDEFVIIASGKNISGNLTTDKNINVTGLSTGLIGAKFTNSSIGFATQNGSIVNAFIMNNNGLTMGTQNTGNAIDLVSSSKNQLRSHFSSTDNGSYVRIAPEGIELGSLGDIYINTDNFKLQTHSRSAGDYPNGEYINGNTILALGSGFNSGSNPVTGRESISALRTKVENGELDIKLIVNQNGAYFKGNVYADNGVFNGTVYASAGSFTGAVIANSFTLNDNNAYNIATTYALSTSTSQPENSSFTYTSKPTTSQISTYANGLTASQKEQIYLWSKITTSLGGKSTSIYSCEHVNEDGTTDIIKIDYAVNSTASVPSNATWYTDITTAKNQISQSNQFLITRTKIFQNYAWSTSYDFAKLLEDPESPQVYVESIKILYYLSTGNAPSQIIGTTEVTSTVDSTDTWTLVVPSYTGTSTNLYIYYTCEQKKWVNHTPTLEWTAPIQDYGLTVANQHATEASKAAADTATSIEPITIYGLEKNVTWNGTTYALALGNNKTAPMLIGSNGGVTIVDTNIAAGTAGYGSAIVLKGGGIGMHGSTINFTTTDATTTNAISINSSGITMGTTGNITLLSNNIILNSTATGADSLFELKKKASDWTEQNNKYDIAMKYSITNGLEITGAITATSFILSNDSSISSTDYYCISTDKNTPPASDASWQTSMANIDIDANKGKYLWTKTVINIGGQPTDSYTVVYIAEDGTVDGVAASISYAVNNSSTTTPSSWKSSYDAAVSDWNATNPYLWTRTTINGTSSYSISRYTQDGIDGKYVTSIVPLYYLKSTTGSPSAPTSSYVNTDTINTWTTIVPSWPSSSNTDTTNYCYYRSEQYTWSSGNPTYSSVYKDNGLTTASATAKSAATTVEPFTHDGLSYGKSWGGKSYGVILSSSQSAKPLLIGSNAGITIAKSAVSSDGAALVIDNSGIALNGTNIILDAGGKINMTGGEINFSAPWDWSTTGYDVAGSWEQDTTGWYYKIDPSTSTTIHTTLAGSGTYKYPVNDWLYNGGYWYYFNSSGYMVTGKQIINNTVYNFGNSGGLSANNSVNITANGIELWGNHLMMNGLEAWGRDDIIVMKRSGETQSQIEARMEKNHDWVLIKPYYDAEIVYTYKNYGASVVSEQGTNVMYASAGVDYVLQLEPQNSASGQMSFGSNAGYYLYTVTFKATTNSSSSATGCNISMTLGNGTDNVILRTAGNNTYVTLENIPANGSASKATGNGTSGQLSGSSAVNLCTEGANLTLTIHPVNTGLRITDITVTCTCDATTSRVPCTVYYYP